MPNIHNATIAPPVVTTGKGCFPTATQITGTITSTGVRVVGTGTLFLTQLNKGDYIFNTTAATLPEVRRIKCVLDNTHLILETAYSVDVSAIDLHRSRGQYKSVGITNSGSVDGKLNGGDIVNGASPSYVAKEGFVVEPFSYDASGTEFNIFASL